MAGRRLTGQGGRGWRNSPPTPPPPLPSPSLRATGATLSPPESKGTPPLPQTGPRRGGRGCGWTCTPRALAPPAPCSCGGRGRQASPHQRAGTADQAWERRTAAHQNYMEAAPPMTPPMTIAHSGAAEGGFRTKRAPGERSTGRPSSPPPGAAPRPRPNTHAGGECA